MLVGSQKIFVTHCNCTKMHCWLVVSPVGGWGEHFCGLKKETTIAPLALAALCSHSPPHQHEDDEHVVVWIMNMMMLILAVEKMMTMMIAAGGNFMKSWLGSVTNVTHRRRHYDYPPQLHWETLMSEFRF